ncbi:hypothetical protein LTSEINV_1355 [Salmonella enterica subsp. enterica serovar Inverness str. R8-3668]|uniref:Uncharacterized protein n=1 Tax=Salmonella enterica subsp. enterica serovar Inverness str. R8-3668 TaxID=913075 RepID=G5NA82_SALET|nr:hypothetical protein LTSEINV_1355 [Salmonella enterica subsp. enterica serovar Inverness str. R8-3668]
MIMRRVCGIDLQCHQLNLYAIKVIKYFKMDKKDGQVNHLSVGFIQYYAS